MKEVEILYDKFKLNKKQKDLLEQYYKLIHEYNQKMNLTGIDDKPGVYLKHFYDSLLLSKSLDEYSGIKIADLGSGAGFPGIILAIYYPTNEFFLIEPITKRCKFLNIVVEELNLNNVTVVNKRAEEIEKDTYDIVVSRAVSSLNILLELAIPIVKVDGFLLAQKGPKAKEEVLLAQNALKVLNSTLFKLDEEVLPIEESIRYNIKIKKNKKTDLKYPRNYGQIKKKPL